MSYPRVIPRDLFNEASLLKCYGQVYLKLEELGLLEIVNKKITRKGEKHRFFKIDSDIFITINKTKEEVQKKGLLKRLFKEGIKFAVIGVASFFVWEIFDQSENISEGKLSRDIHVYPLPQDSIEHLIWVPVIIIVCGILLIWFRKLRKKRK